MFPATKPTPSTADDVWRQAAVLSRRLQEGASGHFPTQVMLDFAYGGLDEEILRALYGQHIEECSICLHGVEVYREERPADPACLMEVPEFSRSATSESIYELSPKAAGQRLLTFIERNSGPLQIVAGEANPEVYDQAIGRALRERGFAARRAGVTVPQIICGPAMGLNDAIPTAADAVLPALAEEAPCVRVVVA